MTEKLSILMIDDHPLILDGYKNILLRNRSKEYQLTIDIATSCEEAIIKIESCLNTRPYDIFFLDMRLPPSTDKKYLSGEDIGKRIRKLLPDSGLAVLTMFSENLKLLNIIETLNPDAFMIKSDVSTKEFLDAFDKIVEGKTYSSQTIHDLMRRQIRNFKHITKTDQEILFYLSKGLKSREIPKVVPISLASVEKRKKKMRDVFNVKDVRDITLINKAKELGFL